MYFHKRIIRDHLRNPFPHEDDFRKVKNSYIKCVYYNIYDDYGVNVDEIWTNGDWFYTTNDGDGNYGKYGNFGDGGKCTQRSRPDNLMQWII